MAHIGEELAFCCACGGELHGALLDLAFEIGVEVAQGVFGLFACGDVGDGGLDEMLAIDREGRQRHVDRKARTVPTLARKVACADEARGLALLEYVAPAALLRGHENLQRSAEEFMRGIAEHFVEGGVGHADRAAMIDKQQPIRRRLDDRLQQQLVAQKFVGAAGDQLLEIELILIQRLLMLLAFGDVAFDRHEVHDVASLVEQRLRLYRHPVVMAVAMIVEEFRAEAALGLQAF